MCYSMGTNESLERGVRGGVRERESGRVGKEGKVAQKERGGGERGGTVRLCPPI